MIKKIVILLFALIPYISFSQQNFLPGYILELNGDTTKGYLDYRNWDRNPNEISFKKTLDSRITKYFPLDIIEFGIHNEIYKGCIVDIETSPETPSREKPDPEIHLAKDTTFLQSIFIGE